MTQFWVRGSRFGGPIHWSPLLLVALGLGLGLVLPPAHMANANEITVQGLSFSDERGSFRLVSVTGTGTPTDPITVTEEVTGPKQPVLIIRGFGTEFGNKSGTFHMAGFAMRKIAINMTDKTWRSYQVELREVEERPSSYGDGLSFGQSDDFAAQYTSSPTFPNVQRVYEPLDAVNYGGADVPPGGKAIMQFIVTDMSPVHTFYLLQQPIEPITDARPPSVTKFARLIRPDTFRRGAM